MIENKELIELQEESIEEIENAITYISPENRMDYIARILKALSEASYKLGETSSLVEPLERIATALEERNSAEGFRDTVNLYVRKE